MSERPIKCIACGSRLGDIAPYKRAALRQGFSVNVYCTNDACENSNGALLGPSTYKAATEGDDDE